MKLKTCPHCQALLQPGEESLGWCGACGNSLWRLPEASSQGEWHWVARGTLVKLIALLVGMAGVLSIAVSAGWDVSVALNQPLPTGIHAIVVAALLDVVGRLLCLGTPQASVRWLVVASVICQFVAVPLALAPVLAPNAEEVWLLVAGAVLAQVAAAILFTAYLFTVGVFFRSPLVMTLAGVLKVTMAGTAGVVGLALLLFALLAVVFVLGVALCFVCPCAGMLVAGSAAQAWKESIQLIGVILAVMLALVEIAYGTTLAAVLWELRRRRLLVR